ncbi:MAG: phosphonoacetaldehyde reductase [Paraglaciecola sp.]|uniref:phosphonoacetaldehyde reductase n=1 Tax=Paraglaciecola sp. TaxID=1920173 RepID=UPI003265F364
MATLLADYSEVNIIETEDYLSDVVPLLKDGNILLVTSQGFRQRGTVATIVQALGHERVIVFDQVTPNPEKTFIRTHYQQLAEQQITNIVALGGGSVIDTAKVFGAMFSYPNQPIEQLLSRNDLTCSINLVGIPTTSGTGAEVTPFATVWENKTNSKHSLYGIKPNAALLDPQLTLTLPYTDTLYPALDTLSHALESIWNKNKTQFSEEAAFYAIELICSALPKALVEPDNLQARKDLQCAATLAGLAISITKTAIAHAISYPLTSKYNVPHGLACSFTLLAIVNIHGEKKLGLPSKLMPNVNKLLAEIDFSNALSSMVSWDDIQGLSKLNFDKSRTGNFIAAVDNDLVATILQKSQILAEL